MLNAVTIRSKNGATLRIPLRDSWSSDVVILKIDGLGPVKSDIYITNYGAQSGGYYNGSRVGTRNVVFTLAPQGDDVEKIRRGLYRTFDVEEELSLVFDTNYGEYYLLGYVESFEPDIFSANSTYVVSILCPDPFYTDANSVMSEVALLSNRTKSFEFPFENPTYADEIEFGTILDESYGVVEYRGDVPVGMVTTIRLKGDPGGYVRFEGPRGSYVQVSNPTGLYKAGGKLVISSVAGSRYAYYEYKGTKTDMAWTAWDQGSWPILYPGENRYRILLQSGKSAEVTLSYNNKYRGI